MKDPIEYSRCIVISIRNGDKKFCNNFWILIWLTVTVAIRFNALFWQPSVGLSAAVFTGEFYGFYFHISQMCIFLRVTCDFDNFGDKKPTCVKFALKRDEQLNEHPFLFPFHINNRLNIISEKYKPNNNKIWQYYQ